MNILNILLSVNKWKKLFSGTFLFVAGVILVIYQENFDFDVPKKVFILMAFPFVYAVMGFVEITTGAPFSNTSEKWDNLTGWQRGLVGTVIITIFCSLTFAGIFFLVLQ